MPSLRNHLRPLVKRILTIGMLSVVVFTAVVATGLAGGRSVYASTQTYTITDLGTLGYNTTVGYGINANGQIVGRSYLQQTVPVTQGYPPRHKCFAHVYHAFLWSNGTMTDFGTLGGSTSIAYAINNAGQVVGYASPPNSSVHAFLYSGGKMTELGVFFDSSVAEVINTSGVVVGTADVLNNNGTTEYHAFIYRGGKLLDLNTLIPSGSGWVLTEATGINDTGQIVCNAYNATTGYRHAFLLNPV